MNSKYGKSLARGVIVVKLVKEYILARREAKNRDHRPPGVVNVSSVAKVLVARTQKDKWDLRFVQSLSKEGAASVEAVAVAVVQELAIAAAAASVVKDGLGCLLGKLFEEDGVLVCAEIGRKEPCCFEI
jgi:hypothetical protein